MTDRGSEASLHPPTPTPDNVSYVRLHVTPLDAELLKVVLSSALAPKARNISYHTLETFPEKRYGFLELPSEDAEKLRKKLNGSVLKGVKIRIERARQSGIPTPLAAGAMAKEKTPKKAAEGVLPPEDKSNKRKRGTEELNGIVLKDGRKIKRGWTSADEPKEKRAKKDKEKEKGKKKQAKSKYTNHPECLIKTILPANAATSTAADHSTSTTKKKAKSREVVVHEFEKTTKFPTFLKTVAPADQPGAPLEFVDGKGWVDEDGNVVEPVKTRPPQNARVLLPSRSKDHSRQPDPHEGGINSGDDDHNGEAEPERPIPISDNSPVHEPAPADLDASPPSSPAKPYFPRPRSSGSVRSLSITIPPATPKESKVHPLEALYKRPRQPSGETPIAAVDGQSFSFFANGNDESVEEDVEAEIGEALRAQVPMTPFTRHDLELRGIRSAAPTPDTAHPGRRLTSWEPENDSGDQNDEEFAGSDSEVDEAVSSNNAMAQDQDDGEKPASDFQMWFWENRGYLNRSWKKRRKLAGKEKRYRENKARIARAI